MTRVFVPVDPQDLLITMAVSLVLLGIPVILLTVTFYLAVPTAWLLVVGAVFILSLSHIDGGDREQ